MGKRGPKPMPTALKLARGTPGHHALNHDEPQLDPPGVTTPPDDLTGFARDEWIEQVDDLVAKGVLTRNDLSQFRVYCQLVGKERSLALHLAKMKRYTAQRLKLERYYLQLATRVERHGALFGLQSSSRSSIKAVKSTANAVDDKRKRFFGARKEKPAS